MRPVLLSFGDFAIHSYHFMIFLGGLIGLVLAMREINRIEPDPEKVYPMMLVMFLSIIAGARIYTCIAYWDLYKDNLAAIPRFWEGGLAYHGALAGGIISLIAYCAKNHLNTWRIGDIFAPPAALSLTFSRIGCFLNGCCYGKPCADDFLLGYTHQKASGRTFSYLPTQLYEAAWAFGLFWLLWWLRRRKTFNGQIWVTFLFLYTPFRFFNEFLRNDPRTFIELFGHKIPSGQIATPVIFLFAVILFVALRKRQRIEPDER